MELATPITVYWDLPPDLKDSEYLKRICGDILQLRPLMLQLNATACPSIESYHVLLEMFTGSQIGISLTVPASCLVSSDRQLLAENQLKELLIASENLSDLCGETKMLGEESRQVPSGTVLGLSISTTRDNWRTLPAFVEFCRLNGLKRIVLPMQRLYGSETPFMLSKDEQSELQNALAAAGGTADINLTIHDPFLWKAFNPGIPFPQGGCQAANTMISISGNGDVYPCPSLPVKLGTIGEATLKEIVASPLKKDFRRSLLEIPGDCRDCAEINVCRGGCRGRAYVQYGTLDGIDSSCR
jgi:GeoRSP system SPASM domain protein